MGRRSTRMVSAALLCMALAGCGGGEDRKASFVASGEAFLAARNFEKARLEFRNALQIDPKDAHVQFLAARAAEKSGEFREALGLYQAVIAAVPANHEARADLARLMLFAGARKEAQQLIDAGLAQQPRQPDLLTIRAAMKLQAGDRAGALADAQQANAGASGSENAAAILATALTQDGRPDEAVAVIEKTLAKTPASIDLRIVLAQLHLAAGRRAAAEQRLKEVIERDPRDINQRFRLAQFHVLGGDIDAAERALRGAVELAPDEVRPKVALANLIATHRSFEAGERSLKDLVAANPRDRQLQFGLGQFYETHGRADAARRTYRELIAADGTGAQGLAARNRLAEIEIAARRPEAARGLLGEVLAENPRDNDALILRARLGVAQGDATGAITDLRAVLRDQPESQPVLRALAQAYLANDDRSLAEDTLRNAVRMNPRDVQTRLALAQLLIQGNRPDEAQPVVDQLVADQPGDLPALEAAFRVQVARGDLGAARRTAETVRSTRPDQPTGHYLLGLVDQADGRLAAAETHLAQAVKIAPEAVEPLMALMRVDIAQGHADQAIRRIDDVVGRHPANPALHNLKGEVLLSVKRPADATRAFAEASRLAPKWWVPYRGAAAAELAAGHAPAAVAAYQRGLGATGGAPQLSTDLASLFERINRPDDAIKVYEDWIRQDSKSDIAANNLAMLLMTHRKDSQSLDRAIELTNRFQNSSNPAFLDTYAWTHYLRGDFNAAVPPLQRAVDLMPKSALLRARLGLAQYRAGQRAAAQDNLERAFAEPLSFRGVDEAKAALAELKRGA